jgi:hypothetical protein
MSEKYYISITDFARSKKTSRQTVYNNLHSLTVEEFSGRKVIILDNKAKKWNPKEHYRPKGYSNNDNSSSSANEISS